MNQLKESSHYLIINDYRIKSKALKESKDGIGAHGYELMRSQIWALLPSFCNNPSDIKDSFQVCYHAKSIIEFEKSNKQTLIK